jgi:hypothetical protein
MAYVSQEVTNKWKPVLDAEGTVPIRDAHKRAVLTKLLENQVQESSKEGEMLFENGTGDVSTNAIGSAPDTGGTAKFDPLLISLVRRSQPNLMAYDIAGVQPMSGPTGLIFCMKSNYGANQAAATRTEALFNEANTAFAGTGSQAGSNPGTGTYTRGTGMTTTAAELLGTTGGNTFNEMNFTIEKTTVTAQTRALKASYTLELAQDLKAVHGLDAEGELSNILSQEIGFELNRELVRTVYQVAQTGAQSTVTPGTFDLNIDSSGRWSVERFKGLLFQIERDANAVGQLTRRGKGNILITSSDVASALALAGVLNYAPALQAGTNLEVDDTGNTFAGILNGKIKVYIDPYSANISAASQFYVVGYKGQSAYDAGIFYCPYVPLQMLRAVDPESFQPKIAFKSRYGMIANPFVINPGASNASDGSNFTAGLNQYYRKVQVLNLL